MVDGPPKKRGRPASVKKTEVTVAEKKEEVAESAPAAAAAPADTAAAPVKKARGRPKKEGGPTTPKKVPSGRLEAAAQVEPRWNTRSSEGSAVGEAAWSAPEARKREEDPQEARNGPGDRGKEAPREATVEWGAAKKSTPKKDAPAVEPTPAKTDDATVAEPAPKKPRGRPPKNKK
eukprot:CAMPEP_0177774600 /NCGR_PEP_ID=MMETSP0491_2-20121128/13613_1 /TAXON_ID=63592 /ORGANISM="Tetraselmis chuii, Strain PLY429" /LENGTH=175 /DNA_ID=CAMNT_0019293029 /DNA_START=120 /DNA_END=649 /DNA_ORIENTATION=+